ncbi:MAG: fibronectin type III domain-containing protein [Candidatus Aenigmatarchaeota archaeon]
MRKRNLYFIIILITAFIFLNASELLSGEATLFWEPPTTNEDGTPLTDLAGFKVYYGTSSGNYSQNIDVGNVTTYAVNNLTEGKTYYFAVTAYDTSDNESKYSNEVNKTIPIPIQQYTLTVSKAGTGEGTVISSPAGINCGSDCTEIYNQGTVVTLTPTPSINSIFDGWSGGGCSGTSICSISINSPTTVCANFSLKTYTITATAGSGGSISPSGNVAVNYGSDQTFTITPNDNYRILDVKVDGKSQGALTSYTFFNIMDDHTIQAFFKNTTKPAPPGRLRIKK